MGGGRSKEEEGVDAAILCVGVGGTGHGVVDDCCQRQWLLEVRHRRGGRWRPRVYARRRQVRPW